jgi:hypothetical protein
LMAMSSMRSMWLIDMIDLITSFMRRILRE